ncbi:Autophagy-related protein 5 [Caenorhabditis elegans]|uniref:Isoform c of Autophagy-related protein 5 n=1 Tax=Caenorhabditis elegans TaxID=6239 RepID=Q3V5I7-3|nr:Autophagy-related protein 5 [Caenorhabditis elegans]CDM63580.1 Autophagy-related protein 5 [Caenorhabditis elegans]|eukprot:NP_001293440.1 Autophagy protein 5 [Caenorhabditis elegans]
MDYEVCRKVWESHVPCQFTLQSSGGTHGEPLPFYTMLPRFSYLALAIQKVLSSFNRRDDGEKVHSDKMWLEHNGIPLKMYIPIGVIYDQANLSENDSILEIIVRTSQPPPQFQMVDRDMMEAMFMQNIKEADYLKTKAEITKNMMKDESAQLWRSVCNNNFDEFWTIVQKLMETSEGNEFAHIPLRVYVKNQAFKQALITAKHPDGSLRTIGEAVSDVLSSSSSSSTDSQSEHPPRLISHGIDIPHHTPLIFAAKNLSYPDNFIHVVLLLVVP